MNEGYEEEVSFSMETGGSDKNTDLEMGRIKGLEIFCFYLDAKINLEVESVFRKCEEKF